MKFDDALNGALAAGFGGFLIYWSRGFRDVPHIAYGPGFFPLLIGIGLIGAGLFLIARRLAALRTGRAGDDAATEGEGAQQRLWATLLLFVGAVVFYILAVERLGFLLTMPLILFTLVWWLNRRVVGALLVAVLATAGFQIFFQQLMSVPLPWGVLEVYAGVLTW